MEKVYKTMQRTGACSIAVGVIILVTGVTVGHYVHCLRRTAV